MYATNSLVASSADQHRERGNRLTVVPGVSASALAAAAEHDGCCSYANGQVAFNHPAHWQPIEDTGDVVALAYGDAGKAGYAAFRLQIFSATYGLTADEIVRRSVGDSEVQRQLVNVAAMRKATWQGSLHLVQHSLHSIPILTIGGRTVIGARGFALHAHLAGSPDEASMLLIPTFVCDAYTLGSVEYWAITPPGTCFDASSILAAIVSSLEIEGVEVRHRKV